MGYIIEHLDESTYLQQFTDSIIWFTPKASEALIFKDQAEAERVAQTFSYLASRALQVQHIHSEQPGSQSLLASARRFYQHLLGRKRHNDH